MAFRLETFQFDCRTNMPTRYEHDLKCRACCPLAGRCRACCPLAGSEAGPGGAEQEQHDETEDHLEACRGYANLWDGLGPYTMKSRCRNFMRVKVKKLKQQQEDKQRNRLYLKSFKFSQ